MKMKAMLFAAGLGTRLRPLTNDRPKALVEVNGKSLLEIQLRRLHAFGISEVVVNVHHYADMVIAHLEAIDLPGLNIQVSDERDALLETGGGLKKAGPQLAGSDPVLICNVDVLTNLDLGQMLRHFLASGALALMAVRKRETSRYLMWDESLRLMGWKNQKTGETKGSVSPSCIPLAFSGIHIISPDFISLIKQKGKFSIIDSYLNLCKEHLILGYPHDSDLWLDVGKPAALKQAASLLGNIENLN